MKLLALCVFAVFCSSLVSASVRDPRRRRLEEIQDDLNKVKNMLQESGHMFYTPPQNIENCCSLSALRCFRESLNSYPSSNDKLTTKLINGLKKPSTEKSLNFCGSTNTTTAHCQNCTSHPKENAAVFFSRLESLIQQAMTRLNRK